MAILCPMFRANTWSKCILTGHFSGWFISQFGFTHLDKHSYFRSSVCFCTAPDRKAFTQHSASNDYWQMFFGSWRIPSVDKNTTVPSGLCNCRHMEDWYHQQSQELQLDHVQWKHQGELWITGIGGIWENIVLWYLQHLMRLSQDRSLMKFWTSKNMKEITVAPMGWGMES